MPPVDRVGDVRKPSTLTYPSDVSAERAALGALGALLQPLETAGDQRRRWCTAEGKSHGLPTLWGDARRSGSRADGKNFLYVVNGPFGKRRMRLQSALAARRASGI